MLASDNLGDSPPTATRRALSGISTLSAVREDAGFPLAARSTSGIFDHAFDLYKRNFKTLALISALLYFPTQILLHALFNTWLLPLQAHLTTPAGEMDPMAMLSLLLGGLLIGGPEYGLPGVIAAGVLVLSSGPLCVAVADLTLGRTPTVRESYRRARPALFRLLFGWAFIALICFGIAFCGLFGVLLLAVMAGGALGASAGPTVMLALMLIGIVGVYLSCMAIVAQYALFTTPLLTLEGLGISAAWERNRQLVRRARFLPVWAAGSILPVVVFGLQYLILLSSYFTVNAFHLSPWIEYALDEVFTGAAVLLFQPYITILITVLYYDCRVRGEGLDIILLGAGLLPDERCAYAGQVTGRQSALQAEQVSPPIRPGASTVLTSRHEETRP
jgi:hypothetical protein